MIDTHYKWYDSFKGAPEIIPHHKNKRRISVGDVVHIEFTITDVKDGQLYMTLFDNGIVRDTEGHRVGSNVFPANHRAIVRHVHRGQAH